MLAQKLVEIYAWDLEKAVAKDIVDAAKAEDLVVLAQSAVKDENFTAADQEITSTTVEALDQVLEKCTLQHAQPVKKNAKFHSNQLKEDLFIATIASSDKLHTLTFNFFFFISFQNTFFIC